MSALLEYFPKKSQNVLSFAKAGLESEIKSKEFNTSVAWDKSIFQVFRDMKEQLLNNEIVNTLVLTIQYNHQFR